MWFWFWVLAAAILLVAEMLSRDLLYAPFAAGAVAAGFMEWAVLPVGWQWLAFLGLSLALSVILPRRVLVLRGQGETGGDSGSGMDAHVEPQESPAEKETLAREEPPVKDATPLPDYQNVPRQSRRLHRRGR